MRPPIGTGYTGIAQHGTDIAYIYLRHQNYKLTRR